MRFHRFIPILLLAPAPVIGSETPVRARVVVVTIHPGEVTVLHLRPEFESAIRMPEEVTSVILGSPGEFKAEHDEGEPEYVYVKPITREPAQSNLLIATRSGEHVTLELVSEGAGAPSQPQSQSVDLLVEYRKMRGFLVDPGATPEEPISHGRERGHDAVGGRGPHSSVDEALLRQQGSNAPRWTGSAGRQIETAVGEVSQHGEEAIVAFSILNGSRQPVEIVPPQIQIAGREATRGRKREARGTISDQLEIRDFRLSATRLEPGGRVDGAVAFDRPNFKPSTEELFLQIAQADQVDRPILVRLPFTAPISGQAEREESHDHESR